MSARDMFFDFLETVLLIFLITFIVIYIFLGDRLDLVRKMLVGTIPLCYFSMFFLYKQRLFRSKMKKASKEEFNAEQIICPVRKIDIRRDKILISILVVVILALAVYGAKISADDIAQALIVLFIMILRHIFLFVEKDKTQKEYLTIKDKTRDEFINYVLPILIILISIFGRSADILDTIQAAAVFIIFYIWHNYLFSDRN